MDTGIIKQLYNDNKNFDGKQIKFFQDPDDIKKHKYVHILRQDEEVVFGIKKFFEVFLFTDRAIYFVTAFNEKLKSHGVVKRMAYDDIYNWHIDASNCILLINEHVMILGLTLNKEAKAFIQSLDIILSAILGKNNKAIQNRKSVDVEKIVQLIKNNCSFEGVKFKNFKEPIELKGKEHSSYSVVWNNNEQIIIVFDMPTGNFILTDSAFYYKTNNDYKRLALKEINRCEAVMDKTGKLIINNDVLELRLDLTKKSVALLHSIENIMCGIIDYSIGLSSLKQICFNDTVTAEYNVITKRFTEQLDENDIIRAHQICLKAYTQAVIPEVDVFVDDSTQTTKIKHYMDINQHEKLLFNYDNDLCGFYITNHKLGFYNNGKKKVLSIYLPQIKSITIKNIFGRLFLIVNNNENMAVEIERPYANACAFLFMSLFASTENIDMTTLINFIEQFRRLRMLTSRVTCYPSEYNEIVTSSILRNFECTHQPDELLAVWSSDGELIFFTKDKLHFSQVMAEGVILSKDFNLTDIRNIRVDMHWRNQSGKTFATALVFGAIPAALLYGDIILSHFELNINNKVYRFNTMQARDIVLLKFILALLLPESFQSA